MERERIIAKVINSGRVTIPLPVRELLGISDGDTVEITVKKLIDNSIQTLQIVEETQIVERS